jgi:hypothetical protein
MERGMSSNAQDRLLYVFKLWDGAKAKDRTTQKGRRPWTLKSPWVNQRNMFRGDKGRLEGARLTAPTAQGLSRDPGKGTTVEEFDRRLSPIATRKMHLPSSNLR